MGLIDKTSELSAISGKVGDLVLYQVQGKMRVRQRGDYQDAKTQAQLVTRQRMAGVVMLYRVMKQTLIPQIWKIAAEGLPCSGYNLFTGMNMRAYDGAGGIVFEKLRFSMGSLPQGDFWTPECLPDGTVRVTWSNRKTLSEQRLSDRLMVVVMYRDGTFSLLLSEQMGIERRAGEVEIHPQERENAAYLYCFFAAKEMDRFSDDCFFDISP